MRKLAKADNTSVLLSSVSLQLAAYQRAVSAAGLLWVVRSGALQNGIRAVHQPEAEEVSSLPGVVLDPV